MPKSLPLPPYKTRRRWTQKDARAALDALASSGLSTNAFAQREGLDPQRLRSWLRKLDTRVVPPSSAFVEVRAPAVERLEVVLRSGITLRVATSIDASSLRRLVEALDRPC